MRSRVVEVLKAAGLDPVSVETPLDDGIPDVNYTGGWLELKQIPRWPARPATPVRVPHFRREQRIWLRRRCRAGGRAYVLLRVSRDWLLIDGAWAADHLGDASAGNLISASVAYWPGGLDTKGLVACLTST